MELQFLGAAQEVTGSCFLLRVSEYQILIDCGLVQGNMVEERRNYFDFPFNPKNIDAVILSHAHLDHSGRLPSLVKSGFNGPIYTHLATRDLCKIMLYDAAYLNERDIKIENNKRQRKHLTLLEPLYSDEDVALTFKQFRTLTYDKKHELLPGITVQLRDAGHILGSAIIELWIQAKGINRKLVFSGDLGHPDAPILKDPTAIKDADLVILESTYGDRDHRPWDATFRELKDSFEIAYKNRGNVLIPTFTIGRTQELLYLFHRYFEEWNLKHWHIFLDSPMAIEATEVYAKHWQLYDQEATEIIQKEGSPFRLPNLTFALSSEESMKINHIQSGAIIIAGNGMCTGGRIRHHLKHRIWRSDSHVFFIGYQAKGTVGRALVNGTKQISLWGERIRVSAHIHTIGGLSAHAGQKDLIHWYQNFSTKPPVVLVHGEPMATTALADVLHQQFAVSVMQPKLNMSIDLVSLQLL